MTRSDSLRAVTELLFLAHVSCMYIFFFISSRLNGGLAKDNEEALEVVENVNEETEHATRTHARTHAHKDATRAIFSGKQKNAEL